MKDPIYDIIGYDDMLSTLTEEQLRKTLDSLPLSIEIQRGHDLSLTARVEILFPEEPILEVRHSARLIELKPKSGKRLADAAFYGKEKDAFSPSRVMDECTGGGACCSYQFNTKKLGLPFDYNLTLDIKKFG